MTDAPLVKGVLSAILKPVSSTHRGSPEADIVQLRDAIKSLNEVVAELQSRSALPARTAQDGLPLHGQASPLLQGQWLRLTQASAAPSLHSVNHGLGRRPIGAIWLQTTGINKALIAGDTTLGVQPASSSVVVFQLNGALNEEHICILL